VPWPQFLGKDDDWKHFQEQDDKQRLVVSTYRLIETASASRDP
jgi:hypothetical protein